MSLSKEDLLKASTIILALESGGQVYGNAQWDNFSEPYANSPAEHAITIGAGAWYGQQALRLLIYIHTKYPEVYQKYDYVGIYEDFKDTRDWSRYSVKADSPRAKVIKQIISSPEGIQCQKELLAENLSEYAKSAESLGVTDTQALVMCCNFHHQGGYGAMKRVIGKTDKPYTLDNLYKAVCTDTVPNQIGTYKARQKACYNMIKEHIKSSSDVNLNNTKPSTLIQWSGYIKEDTIPRSWAGKDNSPLKSIDKLSVNSYIGICDTIKSKDGSEWYYICINNSIYGFVPASSVSKTKINLNSQVAPSPYPKWKGIVVADSLNVRAWAGVEHRRLASVPYITEGTVVDICDTVKSATGEDWYYVCINKITYGFVHSDYIKKVS